MRSDGKSLSHIARVLGVGKSSVARALERSDELGVPDVREETVRRGLVG